MNDEKSKKKIINNFSHEVLKMLMDSDFVESFQVFGDIVLLNQKQRYCAMHWVCGIDILL